MGSNAISGATTLAVTNTTNQITLGTTNTVTLSSTAPSTSRTYTINPIAGNGEFSLISTAGSNKISVSYETAVSITAANTIVLTADQLAKGIIMATFTDQQVPFTLALPSGADMAANSSLAVFNTAGAVFKVLCVVGGTVGNGDASLASNMGCTVTGPVTLVVGFSRMLYFVAAGSSVWNVY